MSSLCRAVCGSRPSHSFRMPSVVITARSLSFERASASSEFGALAAAHRVGIGARDLEALGRRCRAQRFLQSRLQRLVRARLLAGSRHGRRPAPAGTSVSLRDRRPAARGFRHTPCPAPSGRRPATPSARRGGREKSPSCRGKDTSIGVWIKLAAVTMRGPMPFKSAWLGAFLASCPGLGRRGARRGRISRKADPHHGALCAGREHRRHRAHHRRQAEGRAGRHRAGREQGRRLGHDRLAT